MPTDTETKSTCLYTLWKFRRLVHLRTRASVTSQMFLYILLVIKYYCHQAFRCLITRRQILNLKYFTKVLKYFTSEGAVSHNVLYYQPLPITRYQVRFYANKYF